MAKYDSPLISGKLTL